MKHVRHFGKTAVMVLLLTILTNLTFVYAKPNPRASAKRAAVAVERAETAGATAKSDTVGGALAAKQVDPVALQASLQALAKTSKAQELRRQLAKDKALTGKLKAILNKKVGEQEKTALLVSAFRGTALEGSWWDCVGTCLRSAGVGVYSLILCIATCVMTLGIMCAVCLGVTVGLLEICGALCAMQIM